MATPGVIAISPSGRWLATTESSSSTRVSIRDSNTGRLQCTIRCPTDHGESKLVWITDTLMAAAADTIVLLDVTRGVALTTTHHGSKLHSHTAVMDVAVMDSLLYVLERKNSKLVVYEYNQEQQLLRKIKVGKVASSTTDTEEMKLLATTGYLLAGSSTPTSSWRVVDRSTGSKICKIVGHIMAAAGSWACGSTQGSNGVLTLWNLAQTGQVGGTIAAVATDAVQLFALSQRNECHLLAGNKQLFRIKAHNGGDDERNCSMVSSELVCELPDQETRKQKDVHYILHQEVRALRFTDEMECMSQIVNTSVEAGGLVTLEWEKTTEQQREGGASSALKRKQQPVILGPGQAGHEATNLTEATTTAPKKRSRTEDDEDSNGSQDGMETEDDGPTIAERLALLQKTLEEEEAKERESEAVALPTSTTTKMTTESLYQLLHQALQSADKQQLEMALQVRDPHTVSASCQELDSESAAALLVALTHRLATQPTRADHFSVWLSAILSNPHVSVEHLMPLQNLLQERLEIFPMLLELEGRLEQLAGT